MAKRVENLRDFLEIGCGTGFVLQGIRAAYPETELFGSEYFQEGLEYARERIPSATFVQLDATEMQETDRYDAIGAFDVIEHIEQDEKVLNNLERALRPGGKLFVTVPQHRWLWSAVDEHVCHVRRYTRAELIEKVKNTGLQIEYVTSFVCLLVPLMWLARLRAKTSDYDPMGEFQIPEWLNRSLEIVMNIEFSLLRLGVRFPIGGSLLLVAAKQ